MKSTEPTIQISTTLFWKMYNALHNAHSVLWKCDGAINPEDEDLMEEINEASELIAKVLDRCEPIVSALKDIDDNSN